MSFVETAVEARAPALTLPREREREQTDFGTDIFYRTVSASGAPEDAGSPSIRRSAPPLPLAGEGWALSVPSPLVGEGQGGGVATDAARRGQ